jgi:hypothetical protein
MFDYIFLRAASCVILPSFKTKGLLLPPTNQILQIIRLHRGAAGCGPTLGGSLIGDRKRIFGSLRRTCIQVAMSFGPCHCRMRYVLVLVYY